ncbi:MAG: outer membrane protein, partial [Betaproteobacteria bacterium]
SLFYVTGGLAATTLKVSNHFTDTFATANESSSASKTKYGWVLGLGYEQAMENKWSLKAEYLHAHFDRVTSTSNNLTAFGPAVAFPSNTFTNRGNLQLDMIRIGFNKQF